MTVSVQEKIIRLAATSRRSTELLAHFSDGFADGWYMAVRACFRAQLDIKYTAKSARSEIVAEAQAAPHPGGWTQGPRIAFDRGHVFYDSPKGYQCWSQAVREINTACIVKEAKPNDVRKLPATAADSSSVLVDGHVVFDLFTAVPDRCGLIFDRECKCSQNDFVAFLMDGDYRRFKST